MKRCWPTLPFALIAVAFFAPAIFFEQMPTFRDYLCTFVPFKLYAAQAIRELRFPLWIREYSLGTPFFAAYLNGLLYPPSWIVLAMPSPLGVGLYLAFHATVAGAGMERLLRRRSLGAAASAFGAIAFMLGGLMISVGPWGHLAVLAWIPLVLLATEDVVADVGARRLAWLVFLLALQVLGGGPESFVQSAALVAGVSVVACRRHDRGAASVAWVAVAGALALALCAVQLLPTIEYFRQTDRHAGLSTKIAFGESLDPRTLLTLVAPHRLDGGIVSRMIEGRVPLLWSIYIGVLPFGATLVGAVTRRGLGWALVLAASLVLALGEHTWIYPFLFDQLPGVFGAFRFPQKFLVTAHVAACILAATGFDRMVERLARLPYLSRRSVALGSLVAVGLTLADLWQVHFPAQVYAEWGALRGSPPSVLLKEGFGARIYHYQRRGVGLERWIPRYWQGRDLRARSREFWAELTPDVPIVYGIDFVNGNDAMSLFRDGDLRLVETLGRKPLPEGLHLLRALGVRYLVGEAALEDAALETVQRLEPGKSWVYRLGDPAPRIYLARRFRRVASTADAFEAMASPGFAPGEDAVVADPVQGRDDGTPSSGRVTVVSDAAESLDVDVDAPGEALLIVQDSDFPGWRATIDGEPTRILRANGMVRAVEVPSGLHRVSLVYRPASFRQGLWISAASAAGLSLVLLVLARRKRG